MSEDSVVTALRAPLASGVPESALAVYARWWQLETYLRQVVYTELRAKYGMQWIDHLGGGAASRAEHGRVNAYMASADADEVLAYADVTALFRLIETRWELFAPVLLPEQRWAGLVETLLAIRHRSAHCRRPHADDLGRIEQALRDLEPGARVFFRSYHDLFHPDRKGNDPVIKAWLGKRHPAAARLVEHCRRQYRANLRFGYTVRPWAPAPADESNVNGSPGILWNAHWVVMERDLYPASLWNQLPTQLRELLVHLLFDGVSMTATFAAVDDPTAVADGIGDLFDVMITTSRPMRVSGTRDTALGRSSERLRGAERLPPKVQIETALAGFDPYDEEAFGIFLA